MTPAISCQGLSKHYDDTVALDNLNLEIEKNTIIGFLGVNGAGKTTTIKLLNNLIKPTSGNAYICGISILENPLELKNRIGYLSQEPAFYPWMTGPEFLYYVGKIFNIRKDLLQDKIRLLLEEMELLDAGKKRIGEYSTGMRQRLGIAQALINDPDVLFLDEPVSALDPMGRISVLNIIKSLKGRATIFMSSHILNDVEKVCDEVAIINKGELIIHENISALIEKYIPNAFLVQCNEPLDNYETYFFEQDFIHSVELIRDSTGIVRGMKIFCKDHLHAEKKLPSLIIKKGLTLKKYEVLTPTLEDIFVSLIKKEPKKGNV